MKHFRTKFSAVIIALCAAFAVQSASAQTDSTGPTYTHWWLPDTASVNAPQIDDLFYLILWITSIVFVLVFALMVIFLVRYRHQEGRRAIYSHGNNRLEIIWTIVPALIVLFLGIISQSVWSEIKSDAPEKPDLVITVKPRQFQWDVSYSGADGKFDTKDDITATNQVYVPKGKMVLVELMAQDVIHSFFIPEFRMKQDAVPGMVTRMWFTATKTGKLEIACAELCGLGHGRMRGYLNIMEPDEFDKWYADKQAEKAKQLAPPPAAAPAASASSADTTATAPAADSTTAAAAPADTAAHDSASGQ